MTCRISFLTAFSLTRVLFLSPPASAECSALTSGYPVVAGTIGLVPDETLNPRVIVEAIDLWKACDNYGVGFPAFRLGATGTLRQVVVKYQRVRHNPGRRKKCGWFSGNTITLFGYVATAKGFRHCGTLSRNLAHEMGHVLGLVDAPEVLACATHIMSDLTPANLFSRFVRRDECLLLEARWLMPAELADLERRRRRDSGDLVTLDELRRSSRRSSSAVGRSEL